MPPREDQQARIEALWKDLSAQIRALESAVGKLTVAVEVGNHRADEWSNTTWPTHLAEHEKTAAALGKVLDEVNRRAEENHRSTRDRSEAISTRVASLEDDRSKARGAAIASKVIFGAIVAVVGFLSAAGALLAHEHPAPAPQVHAASPVGR